MNNNECGCMGSGYTFGSDSYGSMYNGNYGDCGYDNDNCDCRGGNHGNYEGCSHRKCAFVRDDDDNCGHNHRKDNCDRHDCHKDNCDCHSYKDDCGCRVYSFRFCIPPFPFRCGR